jgi:hypothetical protein
MIGDGCAQRLCGAPAVYSYRHPRLSHRVRLCVEHAAMLLAKARAAGVDLHVLELEPGLDRRLVQAMARLPAVLP